jgi:LacI family transcriptional regulator
VPNIPQRYSLVGQTVLFLDARIAAGHWTDWLPPERTLCETLQVSRSTLRRALAQMQHDGRIRAEHGSGNRILQPSAPAGHRLRSVEVGLLAPEPLERMRQTQALWIDELRALLAEHGCRLHIFHGPQYYRANPAAALEKLVRQNRHGCWVLTLASRGCQEWFAARHLPCLIAGSCHEGVDLPFRDLDHRATCRHAAGVLLGAGHRQLAFITQDTRLAGDLESEAGFLDAVRASAHRDAHAVIGHHDGTREGITQLVNRLLAQKFPPSALLVAHASHYLGVVSRLAHAGLVAPRDFSIISRDEDPFLHFLTPEPAHYVAGPRAFARTLLQPVLRLLEGNAVSPRAQRLMPKFARGGTIAPPRQVLK